jgi:hypothetical protein
MKGYEFTKRGLVIIVILVIALIVLPISVISVRALSGTPDDNNPGILTPSPDPDPDPNLDPSLDPNPEPSPDPSPEPSPDPSPEPSPDPSPEPSPDPSPEPSPEPSPSPDDEPEPGPVDINVTAGTLSFMFSPQSQDSIDTETVSMIRDFLNSPVNTSGSRIVAGIPNLEENETVIIIDAIIGAFAQYGVSQNRLTYVTYPAGTSKNIFEISFSFERVANQK